MQAARLANEKPQVLATRVRDPARKQAAHRIVGDHVVRALSLLACRPGFRVRRPAVRAQAREDFKSPPQRADGERRVTGSAKCASGTHSIHYPWRKDCGKPQPSMSENVPHVSETV